MVKNWPTNAGNLGSIPGSGRSPRVEEMAAYSSILAWEIPWTEEPGRSQHQTGLSTHTRDGISKVMASEKCFLSFLTFTVAFVG